MLLRGASRVLLRPMLALPRGIAVSAVVASSAAGGHGGAGTTKLWGGRFSGETDPLMEEFNASIGFDKKLWRVDIQGSQAYARALARAGIISEGEAATLVSGLDKVRGAGRGRGGARGAGGGGCAAGARAKCRFGLRAGGGGVARGAVRDQASRRGA